MPITKYNYQIRSVEDIPKVINEAFHIATTGRKGPVVIDLPKDMTIHSTAHPSKDKVHLPSYQPTTKPHKRQLQKLIQALEQAKRPTILIGAGVIHSGAGQLVRTFAEKYQIPLLSTLLGLGAVPSNHPLHLGMGGMHGSYAANLALTDCDLLINLGSRFDDRLASAPKEFAPKALIAHIDIDPAEIGKVIATNIPIVADVQEVMQELLQAELIKPETAEWVALCQARQQKHPFQFCTSSTEIKAQQVIQEIGEITQGEAIIATDVGQHQMWVAQFYPFQFPHQLVTSGGLGTMGYGIPAGIGAKFGNPTKEVVVFVGDGGFQMTNQELAILNENQLSIKFVVLNNGSLGMVRQWQETFFNERRSASVFQSQPDFVKLAEAYGIKAVRFANPLTIQTDLRQAFAEEGSLVIEVVVSQTEHVLPMIPVGMPNDQMMGVE